MTCRHPLRHLFSLSALFWTLSPLSLSAQYSPGAAPSSAVQPATQQPSSPAPSTSSSEKAITTRTITLEGSKVWVDTGVTLAPGQRVAFHSEGKLRYSDAKNENGPEGLARGFRDLIRILPYNDAGRGAVIGRIGDADFAQPFLIGAEKEVTAPVAGKLSIGINQSSNDTGDGSYTVKIELHAPDKTLSGEVAKAVPSMPGIDNSLFTKIPRRISDKDGNPGDMVNFLILGDEDQMKRVFTTAGWVKVDADVKATVLAGAIASFSKEAYLTMPMSQLYLFGRPQDYGWAHAEPITVVASRNHLRVWKAPFTVDGRMLWVGAATHDIGFERDQRNNSVTHKIDPDIDKERDYVEKTLSSTGLVTEITHFTPSNPLKEAKTATGGSFHSDGQVLVLKLGKSTQKDMTANFNSAFCNLLANENPDGGSWKNCAAYLGKPDAPSAALGLPPLATSYRLLVIPGIFSSCQENTKAFQQAQEHLRDKHEMSVEFLQMPNESSPSNGRLIADYLRKGVQSDSRKYIVVSYSKGTPDVQEALAADAAARSAVAAHISVSGAVGGSPIADTLPQLVDKYAAMLKFGTCQGDLSNAYKSLRQDVRQRFLNDHPDPAVPSFSLVAVSDRQSTSKMMLESWRILSAMDPNTDGQILRDDAILPGAAILGTLHADHLAVALDYGSDASADDPNHFPRAALLEAAIRVAAESLAAEGSAAAATH